MTNPTPTPYERRRVSFTLIADILTIMVGLAAGIYFLVDETPEDWLVRFSLGMAITAGVAVFLFALASLANRMK